MELEEELEQSEGSHGDLESMLIFSSKSRFPSCIESSTVDDADDDDDDDAFSGLWNAWRIGFGEKTSTSVCHDNNVSQQHRRKEIDEVHSHNLK